jgi:hypothetical protein
MSGKLSNSWDMIKSSYNVLKSDKELILFPIISITGVVVISIIFIIPFVLRNNISEQAPSFEISNIVILFLYYLCIYTVIIFSNSALIGAALIRMRGGNPTIGDGISIAMDHFFSILGYAFIASTIGVILKTIQERFGIIGKIFAFIANFAWSVLTFLVVPVLVVEGIGPVDAIKRSAELLKKTWGEQIIGNMGISLFFGLIVLALMVIFLPLAIYTSVNHLLGVTIAIGCIFGLIILSMIVISSSLNTIYIAALYRYAAEGVISESFNENILRNSFREK